MKRKATIRSRQWRWIGGGSLVAYLLLGGASQALGAPDGSTSLKHWAEGVSPIRRAQALALYKTGNRHFENSEYRLAAVKYVKALKSWDHPRIRYNLAVCYVNLEKPLLAHKNLRKALRYGKLGLKQHFVQAKTYLRLLRGQLGEVVVTCQLKGARVTLDGQLLFVGPGKASRTILVGKHVVLASKKKHLTQTKTLSLFPGRVVKVKMAPMHMKKAFKMQRRWARWIPWTVLGAGLTLAAVGVPMTIKADATFTKYDRDFKEACPDGCMPDERPQPLQDLYNRGETERGVGIAFMVTSGALLAAGVTLILLNQPRTVRAKPKEAPNKNSVELMYFTPSAMPGGAAVMAGFRF